MFELSANLLVRCATYSFALSVTDRPSEGRFHRFQKPADNR
jgi:hypothetical protein